MRFSIHKFRIRKIFSREPDLQRLVFLLCVLVFTVCEVAAVNFLAILPARSDAEMAAARSLYRESSGTPSQSSVSEPQEEDPFQRLKKINGDVEGWITLPGTVIDYPVLLAPSGNPDYYLTHDWQRNETKYGSIFQQTSGSGANEKNTILFGHSMKDGRMFEALLNYESLSFYRAHPVVKFQKDGDEADWKIFAVIKTNTDPSQGKSFDYLKTSFSSDADFLEYLYDVRIRSIFSLPVDLQPSDEILTLSTCSYEFEGFRTVVFARRVRLGENPDVGTAKAEKNPKVLYPDCWYKRSGGKKPVLPSFTEVMKNGGPDWLAGS